MKINITNKQYKNLVLAVGIANNIFGYMGDFIEEPNYKPRAKEMESLRDYLLQFAKDFHCQDLTEVCEGEIVLKEEVYDKEITAPLDDYDEITLCNELARKLAWRDLKKDHSETEMKKMEEKNGGYFGVELHPYEEKYWNEFDEHDYNRLEIKQ